MNTWVRRSMKAGVLTAGAVMATGTAAYADASLVSAGNTGVLNGTQAFAPVQAPINLCGVAVAAGGDSVAGCTGGSAASIDGLYDAELITAGNHGLLNGTQIFAPVQAPINVCGVAVGLLGDASAWCEGGASATVTGHHKRKQHDNDCDHQCGHDHGGYVDRSTEAVTDGLPLLGNLTGGSSLTGTSGLPLIGSLTSGGGMRTLTDTGSLPVVGSLLNGLLDSNRASLGPVRRATESDDGGHGGNGNSSNGGEGGGHGTSYHPKPKPKPRPHPTPQCDDDHGGHGHGGHGHDGHGHDGHGHDGHGHDGHGNGSHRGNGRGHDVSLGSIGNHGVLNGTQVYAPVQIPVDISGVAIGVLGDASAWSVGGSSATR